nr:MucR family transcriptional regulator [Rhizobium freirei]
MGPAETFSGDELFVRTTARIVGAYVSFNHVPATELPATISAVKGMVRRLAGGALPSEAIIMPAVTVRDSVTGDFIICLEDGKKFRSLKRHLVKLGFTPEEYRAKWKLPADYPMVAPNYSTMRSRIAREFRLGRRREKRSPVA